MPETVARLGRALGECLRSKGGPKRVLMGRDTRASGPMLGGALMSGLVSAGVDVTVAGVLPTPGVARLCRGRRFGLGVVISASHNPAGDNGIKLFASDGRKATPDFEARVESLLGNGPARVGGEVGAYEVWHAAPDAYLKDLLREFADLDLSGLTLVVDCANGAASRTAPEALSRLGARVIARAASPDGKNINRRCGATYPKAVARAAAAAGADLGVSLDGDADRAILADEKGRLVDGDAVLALLARDLLGRRRLPHRTVVATVMSNLGLELSLAEVGIELARTPVGDRQVVAAMDRGGFALGGEQSGHVIVARGRRAVGDGLETTLHVLRAMRSAGAPLSKLASVFRRSPQHLVNVVVDSKPDLYSLPTVRREIERTEREFSREGRVVVRYSGTERLARVMVEGPTAARTREAAGRIAGAIEREIGRTP